jgi:hypothetical protein
VNRVWVASARRRESAAVDDIHSTVLRRWRPTTTKEWLLRAVGIENNIASLENARVKAWTRATSATATIKETPGGGGDVTANKADAYIELNNMIEDEQKRLALVRAEIISTIAKVPSNELRTLLTDRYVNGCKWRDVARNQNYSESHVKGEMHVRALQAVERIRTGCA